jgi:hypothetical protein
MSLKSIVHHDIPYELLYSPSKAYFSKDLEAMKEFKDRRGHYVKFAK